MISLDTNVVVDLVRQNEAVRARYDNAFGAQVPMAISSFTLQELLFGVALSSRPDQERAKLARILQELEVLSFEPADAEVGGKTQALMERDGLRAPLGDFLVGVHALARGRKLVTANTRHFENIPGLELLDWRQPPALEQDLPHA